MSENEEKRSEEPQGSSEAPGNALVPVYWLIGLVVVIVILTMIGSGK